MHRREHQEKILKGASRKKPATGWKGTVSFAFSNKKYRSVVVTFSLVSDCADVDSTGFSDFKEYNVASRSERHDQFTRKGTRFCFAATERADLQKLASLSNRFNRFEGKFKITGWAVEFTFKDKIKQPLKIVFGLTAEYNLVLHV
jgi:hypothetical protein